ncbi:MAG: SRPBCC family protein [Nocardia sp.]|nr:SRPBCC family protein [Nocardia sp.]
MSVTHATFTLERRYNAPIDRVFGAWAAPEAKARWMARGAQHTMDFSVGGLEVVQGFDGEGRPVSHESRYTEIVPNGRILTMSTLRTGDRLSTTSVTSVEFEPDGDGTRITLTEHGMYLPGQERPEWREHGTSEQLDALALEFDAVGEAEDK